jgi:hypothetical protein
MLLAATAALLMLAGCTGPAAPPSGSAPPATSPPQPVAAAVPGSQRVVEAYLKAAADGDGAGMYALIADSERKRETPKSLGKTAKDRYSSATTWEVLKTEESASSSEVIADTKGAKVDPNPTKFTLTRENGEWRIVESPELHEREKNGGIHIKL